MENRIEHRNLPSPLLHTYIFLFEKDTISFNFSYYINFKKFYFHFLCTEASCSPKLFICVHSIVKKCLGSFHKLDFWILFSLQLSLVDRFCWYKLFRLCLDLFPFMNLVLFKKNPDHLYFVYQFNTKDVSRIFKVRYK